MKSFGTRRAINTSGDAVHVVNREDGRTEATFYSDADIKCVSIVPDANLIAIGDHIGSVQILRFETA